MFATIVNAVAVILGAGFGLIIGSRLSDDFKKVVMTSAGLVTMVLGLQMAMAYENILVLLFALIAGGLIGYALKIEDAFLKLGERFSGKSGESSRFAAGFLNSSLLFCSGAMSIVGSIQAGTSGDFTLIYTKSVMDGFMAIVFAAVYGPGVFLSAATILIYQGFFTLTSGLIAPLLGDSGINAIAAEGGFILLLIALSLLEIKKTKTGNFIPALLTAPVFMLLYLKIAG
jgi:Uncharacterized membrane protein, possible Na+ channel or pump